MEVMRIYQSLNKGSVQILTSMLLLLLLLNSSSREAARLYFKVGIHETSYVIHPTATSMLVVVIYLITLYYKISEYSKDTHIPSE